MTEVSKRCVLIGGDSLLAACGDVLLSKGMQVVAVMTRARVVREWCTRNSIPVLPPTRESTVELARLEFAHLFSIAHLSVVPEEVLRLLRGEAINFHDAPLPDLAGLNTPNWAILRGEREHGVTWHRMTVRVDEGEILAQERFPIEPGETALSLNTKCFEAGLRTFGSLIDQLLAGRLEPRAQDVRGRAYYSRADRPEHAGVVDWNRSASHVETLVRATDAGRYKNPFGWPTITDGEHVWVVRNARAVAVEVADAPGTVIGLEHGRLDVATGEGVLSILEVSDRAGRSVALDEVRARVAKVGGRFLVIGSDVAQRLDAWNGDLGRHEEAWIERLAQPASIELPFLEAVGAPTPVETRAVVGSTAKLNDAVGSRDPRVVATSAVCAWLGRVAGRASFDVAWCDARLRGDVAGLERWISPRVPARFAVEPTRGFRDLVAAVERELAWLDKRRSFLHDVAGRDPSLSTVASVANGFQLPVAIEHVATRDVAVERASGGVTFVVGTDGACELLYDASRLSPEVFAALRDSFEAFTRALAESPDAAITSVTLVGGEQRTLLTGGFDATDRPTSSDRSIHAAIAARGARTPAAPAVSNGDETITYAELGERSRRLAAHLRAIGVRRGDFVGVCVERSVDLVVSVVAVLETGAAYLPLDPAFPEDRTRFMLTDAGARFAIAQSSTVSRVSDTGARIVRVDTDAAEIAARPATSVESDATPADLAYVIYTSGSTGKPKGVMIEHGNALNFFAGMDERLPHDPPGTWLAVTSLSFDISVLELLWTLTRGFHVVVHRAGKSETSARAAKPVDFSLFYFASDETKRGPELYRLLLEGAKFADANGFTAVWTPERHFHAFGGLYPAPAVAGAAVASITKNVSIRSGSVVLPLHHPIRVVEAWSVVDNLSNGRVGVSFASGWQPNDFVFAPENFKRAKSVMFESLDTVRRLWRGEEVSFPGPLGQPVALRTLPRPVQDELPVWITTAGNPETYEQAGRAGANLLTHLLGQSIEELAPKIAAYRRARADAGFDPNGGVVSLMLHTFVAEEGVDVRGIVRGPLRNYLATSLDLLKKYAWSFPAFKKPAGLESQGDEFSNLSEEEKDAVLEHAFSRYFESSGLFGRPEDCVSRVHELRAIGVDEIACLIDYGIPIDTALDALPALARLRTLAAATACPATAACSATPARASDASIADEIRRHRITHLQCTPSMARMLCLDPESRAALWTIPNLMIGGEAFPPALANDLARFPGRITNMYGPTETTIWSSTHTVEKGSHEIPIGTPIANTRFYVLDAQRELLPVGVPGELWITGDGVARGYHGRDDLTRERFLSDPFHPKQGTRMYRTGDLVRRRPDGVTEFLGRLDHQVKIRGYRIELGEIESLLSTHPGVREVVVVAGTDSHGEARLVAYCVPNTDSSRSAGPTSDELREFLRAKLPEYMVPGWFVTLGALPLTPNGKVDRRALPAPESAQPANSRAQFVAPTGELESRLATLWQEILGIPRVGVDDNFFDVGGHSLLVVRLHRRIGALVDKPVSLTDLYRFPTLRSFAAWASSDDANKVLEVGAERGARRRENLLRRRRDG